MQPVRGDRAVQQVVRRTRPLGSRQPIRIGHSADDAFLESRRSFIGPDGSAGLEAPRLIGQRRVRQLRVLQGLGGGAGQGPEWSGADRAGKDDPAPEQRPTIQQSVAGNGFDE